MRKNNFKLALATLIGIGLLGNTSFATLTSYAVEQTTTIEEKVASGPPVLIWWIIGFIVLGFLFITWRFFMPLSHREDEIQFKGINQKQLIVALGLISAATIGLARPCFAATEYNDTTWWTVEELLSFREEIEREKEIECGDNQDCRIEFDFNMIERGPKYSALQNLIETQIWITGIDPSRETVTVLFFDDDMMLARMGIEEKINLERLFMGWSENPALQLYDYDESHLSNETEGHHVIYYGNKENNGENWLPVWSEVELSAAGSHLIENRSGKINYSAFGDIFNAVGSFDYSSCLKSPDYQEGMGCKMMVSGDQWVSYFPISEEATASDESDGESIIVAMEGDGEAITESDDYVDAISENEEKSEEIEAGVARVIDSRVNYSIPKAPETGKSMSSESTSQKAIELPWWLAILVIVDVSMIIWWFWPTKTKKGRKKSKKSTKGIDKRSTLR